MGRAAALTGPLCFSRRATIALPAPSPSELQTPPYKPTYQAQPYVTEQELTGIFGGRRRHLPDHGTWVPERDGAVPEPPGEEAEAEVVPSGASGLDQRRR